MSKIETFILRIYILKENHRGKASDRGRASMLHVEKEMLKASTAQQVSNLRATELQYYIDHIGSIQTVSTLLAGFAFTAFISMGGPGLEDDAVVFKSPDGSYTGTIDANGSLVVSPVILPWSSQDHGLKYFTFACHLIEQAAVCFCLCEMLYVLMETLIARLLGSRLALRGPDGSIFRATQALASSLALSTRRFVYGLQWFFLSVVCHGLRVMHPVTSMVVASIIASYWRQQWATVARLAQRFVLRDATSTAFSDNQAGRASQRDSMASRRRSVIEIVQETVSPRRAYNFLVNPIAELRPFFDEVDDHHGDVAICVQDARKPTEATRHLIAEVEGRQQVASSGASGRDGSLVGPPRAGKLRQVAVVSKTEADRASATQRPVPLSRARQSSLSLLDIGRLGGFLFGWQRSRSRVQWPEDPLGAVARELRNV